MLQQLFCCPFFSNQQHTVITSADPCRFCIFTLRYAVSFPSGFQICDPFHRVKRNGILVFFYTSFYYLFCRLSHCLSGTEYIICRSEIICRSCLFLYYITTFFFLPVFLQHILQLIDQLITDRLFAMHQHTVIAS